MKLLQSLGALVLIPETLARLYYPPILSPKKGDILAVGGDFTVIWERNATIPEGIKPENVANFTSQVRMGSLIPANPPQQPYDVAYLGWVLDELYPPPNPYPGWRQNFDFYRNMSRPDYTHSGIGWAQFNLNKYFCGSPGETYVIAWYDAFDPMEMSGGWTAVGDCWTG
ncbi:hypothetical protein K505DRAFT_335266 [Melanomma pulvis-pyrius CBS 109.77]|uniref:Lytic polysaccharide monooxygenase n=1 Tax=Melanomma pulvis-pyrius CBS 109.77 TaxID=1314802 RepID=A0A6A6XKG0_9PLEO|nr:hypothetical protein K505DRAFT_335266 [Melanomma pulvis-pyrius CBS 109.77]